MISVVKPKGVLGTDLLGQPSPSLNLLRDTHPTEY